MKSFLSSISLAALVLCFTPRPTLGMDDEKNKHQSGATVSLSPDTLHLDALSPEILCHIAGCLDIKDFYNFRIVSKGLYNLSQTSLLSISGEPEEISGLLRSNQSIHDILLKVIRTPGGYERLSEGYMHLLEDSQSLHKLAYSDLGMSRIFPCLFFALLENSITSYVTEKTHKFVCLEESPLSYTLKKIDSLVNVSNKMREILETEAKANNPIPQFNLGLYHLMGGQIEQARGMFEKAIENAPLELEADYALGLSYYLLGEEEKGSQLMAIGTINILKHKGKVFALSYDSLIDSILFFNFSLTRSNEAARLIGMRQFSRGDYRNSEKILLISRGDLMGGTDFVLGKLYHKTGRLVKRDRFLRLSAECGNSEAQLMLGRSLLESNKLEEAYEWFKRACEKDTPLSQACAAYKLAKIAIKLNDPTHPILIMVKDCFNKVLAHEKRTFPQNLGNISLNEPEALTSAKILNFQNLGYDEFLYTLKKLDSRATQSYNEGDKEKAGAWWNFIAEFEEKPVALHNLGVLAMERGDVQEAKTRYYEAAKKGYALAQNDLMVNACIMHQLNKIETAKEWLILASEFNSEAALILGCLCIEENVNEGRNWLHKSASKGNQKALDLIPIIAAEICSEGKIGEAKEYVKVAALQNQPQALLQLGALEYDDGNFDKTIELLKKSAALGENKAIKAFNTFGCTLYLQGNMTEAEKFLLIGAQFGCGDAQYTLGLMEHSRGNLEKAKELLISAAKQDNRDAFESITAIGWELYHKGNTTEAEEWLNAL